MGKLFELDSPLIVGSGKPCTYQLLPCDGGCPNLQLF